MIKIEGLKIRTRTVMSHLMSDKDYTVSKMAIKLDLCYTAVWRMLNGSRNLSFFRVCQMLNAMEVSMEEFMRRLRNMEDNKYFGV